LTVRAITYMKPDGEIIWNPFGKPE